MKTSKKAKQEWKNADREGLMVGLSSLVHKHDELIEKLNLQTKRLGEFVYQFGSFIENDKKGS